MAVKLGKPTPKGYRVSVGFVLTGGKRIQRKFWLGHNPSEAAKKIGAISALWLSIPNTTNKVWTPEGLAEAVTIAGSKKSEATAPAVRISLEPPKKVLAVDVLPKPTIDPFPTAKKPLTLHEAFDGFKLYVKQRMQAKQIGHSQYETICDKIDNLKRTDLYTKNGKGVYIADCPLASIGAMELEQMKMFFTGRPVSKATGKPISSYTVVNFLQVLGQFFQWAAKAKHWIAPADWRENLYLTTHERRNMVTDSEKREARKPKPHFTLEDLKVLYRYGSPFQRTILLCGVMLGWTQVQISALRKDELEIRDGEMFINTFRTKTQVVGEWWVCPELRERLEYYVTATPDSDEGLLFLTQYGEPIVHRSDTEKGRKSDTVNLSLKMMTQRGKPIWRSWRRTGGQLRSGSGLLQHSVHV
jgi:hypothetical protein